MDAERMAAKFFSEKMDVGNPDGVFFVLITKRKNTPFYFKLLGKKMQRRD